MGYFVLVFGIPILLFFIFLYRNAGKPRKYSKGILVLLLLSIITNVALAQNYTQSLMPYPVNDGISVSNSLAFLIFGDGDWSRERFRAAYDRSTYICLILLVVYAITLIYEKNKKSSK